MGRVFDRISQYISLIVGKVVLLSLFRLIKVALTRKIFISVNEAVPQVKTTGDTKSRYT